jgi:hypothetical protein
VLVDFPSRSYQVLVDSPTKCSWISIDITMVLHIRHAPSRGGSVCLNNRLSAAKWISAMVMQDWLQRSEVSLIRRPPVKARMGPSGIVKGVDI